MSEEQRYREEPISVIRESPLTPGDDFRPNVRMVSPCKTYRLVEKSPDVYIVEKLTRFTDSVGEATMIWSDPVAVPSRVSRLLNLVGTMYNVNARGEIVVA